MTAGERPAGRGLADARAEIGLLQRELGDRRRFDRAILDGIEEGVVTTDPEGLVTFANRAALQLLGVDSDVAGAAVRGLLGLPGSPDELLGLEPRGQLAYALALPLGGELDLELTVSRGEGNDNDRLGFFFIFRDVSPDKQRATERHRFERLAAMGTMVAGFAHEVRNPIAAMRSIAEELQESGVDTPHVTLLLQLVERIERLVRTSLRFGRPAAPRRAPTQPQAIVLGALTELRLQLRLPCDQITVEVEPGLPDVLVDESQIAQALVILLHNALESTGAASRVVVSVSRRRRGEFDLRGRKSDPPGPPPVRIEVIDDGPGVPAAIVNQIFDPFFTTKSSGTGLGLSIAQRLVIENGARIEVASAPGTQTSFSVVVPAV